MTVAEVKIWEHVVGWISWDEVRRTGIFEFEKEFIKTGLDISPIAMPVNKVNPSEIYTFTSNSENDFKGYKGLPHVLSDSLPDAFGNNIINAWLAANGRQPESFNPVERLCYTGKRGMGALEYYPAINFIKNTSVKVSIEQLVQLSAEILSSRNTFKTDLSDGDLAIKEIMRVGTSAGGARPKAVIAFNQKTGEIRSGQVDAPAGFEHWLLKIDGVSENGIEQKNEAGRIEYAYYLMAKSSNIEMAECRILEENDRAHFMTRRFDRIGNEKVHIQTLHAMRRMNFINIATYSYEQAFSVLKQLKLSYHDIEQLYRRMVFNVISRNCDDHTKNLSFTMNRNGKWSLSPAYDICYAYDPTGRFNFQHFLSVNGKYNEIEYSDLWEVGAREGIKNRKEIIEQVREAVSRWHEYAKLAGVSQPFYTNIGSVHKTNTGKN